MKNTLVYIAVIAVFIGGLVFFTRSGKENNGAMINSSSGGTAGSLSVEETAFDFGEISMANGKVSHKFKIKNVGEGLVTIEKIYTSCMCTSAALWKDDIKFGPYGMPGHGIIPKINQKIDAGKEGEIEAIFDPAAHGPAGVGRIERVIYIEQRDGDTLQLQIGATVKP